MTDAELLEAIRYIGTLDYELVRDLSDLIRMELGVFVSKGRRSALTAKYSAESHPLIQAQVLIEKLSQKEKQSLLAVAENLESAMEPQQGKRQGRGTIRLESRRGTLYAYLRYWVTGGGKDNNKQYLRSKYLGRKAAILLERGLVISDELIDAYYAGKLTELLNRFDLKH